MKFTQLQITGFKSFKNVVTVQFDKGITGIVGPNGCGKSNVVDAILWVTGSTTANQLRGDQMEDIIFAGTEKHSASPFAEVSLTLEKTDPSKWPTDYSSLSELVISRRLKRGEDSKYFINGQLCLLRNIHDIIQEVGAMGFSVVEQDTISKMVSAKPDHLKTLIDQVAGTTKFKNKKRLAENKLKVTQQNILRLEDILFEQKKQLKRLEKQANQAQTYTRLKDQIHRIEVSSLKKSYVQILKKIQDKQREMEDFSKQTNQSSESLNALQDQYKKIRESSEKAQTELKQKQNELNQSFTQLSDCEIEIQKLKVSIESATKHKEQWIHNVFEFQKEQKKQNESIISLKDQITKDKNHLIQLQKELDKKQAQLETVQLQFSLLQKQQDKFKSQLDVAVKNKIMSQESLRNLENNLSKLCKTEKEAKEQLDQQKLKCVSLKNNCFKIRKKIQEDNSLHLNLKEEINCLLENITHLQSDLKIKKNQFDQLQLTLIQKESKCKSFQSLKDNLITSLKDQVQVNQKDSLHYSFKKVDVVKNTDSLSKDSDFIFVAHADSVSSAGFIFYGQSKPSEKKDMLEDIDQLLKEINASNQELQDLKEVIDKKEVQLKNHQDHLSRLNQKLNHDHQLAYENKQKLEFSEKELAFLNNESSGLYTKIQSYQKEKDSIASQIKTLQLDYQNFEEELNKLHQESNTLTQDTQTILKKKEQIKEQISSYHITTASIQKDLKNKNDQINFFHQSLDELKQKEDTFLKKSNQNQDSITDNQSHLSQIQSQFDEKKKEYKQMKESQNQLETSYQDQLLHYKQLEKQIAEFNQKSGFLSEQKHQVEVELESMYAEHRSLESKAFENYQIDIKNISIDTLQEELQNKDKNNTEKEENIDQIKKQLSYIGQVNLLALSEYEELSKENQSLQKQFEDLNQSRLDLEKVITEMDKISTGKFKNAFEEVNVRFNQVFSSVFGGGKASLQLVNGMDSQKGVEILVSPPGKKLKNLKLLSGGEKSLTALSMIVALFLVRPAPFCVLDEVDAALDDSNTVRFNSLLIEMAKRCQVIVVTHNKHSMKKCNRLYGVTMEEKGVTQFLSVDIQS